MNVEPDTKLDFQDVLIKPSRSALTSRSAVQLSRAFSFPKAGRDWEGFPLMASNMDTIGTIAMARAFKPLGALVALHKHYEADRLIEFFDSPDSANAFYAMGIAERDLAKYRAVRDATPLPLICLDVANGYMETFLRFVSTVRAENPDSIIMAGNVVTPETTEALAHAGADIVRIGIGSGSVCTTRIMTGVGYPQLSANIECADAAHGLNARICSDGGCTNPGDVAKAFCSGADFVMLGGMLAGHDECEGEMHTSNETGEAAPASMTFYGMSSETALNKHHGGVADYRAAEGKTVQVPYRGPVENTVKQIMGGLRSAMTYIGAESLEQASSRATFVRVGRQHNTVFE